MHARNRVRHRDHRPRSLSGSPAGRDRLHRAGQSHSVRPDLPPLSQSRARHAGRGLRGPRAVERVPQGQAAVRRGRRRASSTSSAMRRWSSTTRRSTSASSMPSSSVPAHAADRARSAGRHAAAGAAQVSGRPEPARRSVRALRHRQFAPHQARRAARRRAAGRGLSRADRGAPGPARACRRGDGAARRTGRPRASRGASGAARCRASPRPSAPRIVPSSRRSGPHAIWRDYLDARRRTARPASAPSPASDGSADVRPARPGAGWRLRPPCAADTARRNRSDRAGAAGSRR